MILGVSCSKDDVASENYIAPKDIIGKQLLFNGGSYDISEFASNGTCKIPENRGSGIISVLTKTPRYTYHIIDSKTATFTCNYSEKCTYRGSYAYYDVSFDLTFIFESSTSGMLNGTAKFVKNSGNDNGFKSHYFNFKNKTFSLE